jgi:hypothetical protein
MNIEMGKKKGEVILVVTIEVHKEHINQISIIRLLSSISNKKIIKNQQNPNKNQIIISNTR